MKRFILFLLIPIVLNAGSNPKRATAVRTLQPPRIDGVMDEETWKLAKPETEFFQSEPDEGKPPSEPTEVRILYDDDALYLGCIMFDSNPSQIVAQLARRDDEVVSDVISFRFDSYNDNQTAYEFTVNAAGVKIDILQFDDGKNEDASWDAVWDVETRITDKGWVAEFKIPFKAIRFTRQEKQLWGLQIVRRIPHKHEVQYWVLIRKTESGWVSKFGSLEGIENIPVPIHLEILPYAVTSGRFMEKSVTFPDGTDYHRDIGFDLKYAPAEGVVVDATFNPDFGQVEADPAVLNLTTYETHYPEKRPFFIEGSQILKFKTFGGDFGPGLFYSRRIGKPISVAAPESGYVLDAPQYATILGAAKISAKNASGLSVGVLEAVTKEETATVVDSLGNRSRVIAVPLSNYSLIRLRQDIMENSNVGFIATSVNRKGKLPALAGGVNWNLTFNDNDYRLEGFVAGSHKTNTDNERISGSAGKVSIYKEGGGYWRGYISADYTTNNYNINDMGFFFRPNDYGAYGGITYRNDYPDEWKRAISLSTFYNRRWNFDGAELEHTVGIEGDYVFLNYWGVGFDIKFDRGMYDDRETRGEGWFRRPSKNVYKLSFETDSRKPFVFDCEAEYLKDFRRGSGVRFEAKVEMKPADNLACEIELNREFRYNTLAWVDNVSDLSIPSGIATIFAERTTQEWDLTVRASLVFIRDFTLQYYGQIFLAKGKYDNFVRMTAPDTFIPYAYNEDFENEYAFHSNLVLRWEYLPGSTLYLVWSQARSGDKGLFQSSLGDDLRNTFSVAPENVLMLKISYWFTL